jgi:hypothetical protein
VSKSFERNGPTVHSPENSSPLQYIEITSNGLCGNTEFVGCLGSINTAVVEGPIDYAQPPLFCQQHCCSPSSTQVVQKT